MNRAATIVAALCLAEGRTGDAAVLCRRGHGARARLHAAATALGACVERAPAGGHAVDGARRRAAALRLVEVLASISTIRSSCLDVSAPRLHATATRLRARAPACPIGVIAVHGAATVAAALRLAEGRTGDAAVLYSRRYRPRTCLGTAATRQGASIKAAPRRHSAIHRTRTAVACLRLFQ